MKNVAYLFLLLALVCGSFLAGSRYQVRTTVAAGALRARQPLYYVDPMHPAYRSDKPGTAPDCGMALEPVYADGEPEVDGVRDEAATGQASGAFLSPGWVSVRPEKQQLIGVRIGTVEKSAGVHHVRVFGRVAPDETRVYHVNVGVDGYIREISGVTTGSHVEKGQWLATFSTPDMRQPIQAFLVAADVVDRAQKSGDGPAALELAKGTLQQATDRLYTLGMSNVQVEKIIRTREVPANVQIAAPASGVVLARAVSAGQKIEKGTELYRIADLSKVWILADAHGDDGQYFRPGARAEVAIPGQRQALSARVSSAQPQFDAGSQTLKVRLEVDNPVELLRPDMFVDVDVDAAYPATVSIPVDALVDSGLRQTVFLDRGNGVFEPRQVETGWRLGDRVEVVKGLETGDRVVVSGTFLLDSESRMRTTRSAAVLGRD